MRKALTISAIGHATLLLWGVVTFVVKPLEANPVESLPVDVISDSEFSQITAGMKSAKKVETPKPLVEKLGEQKPVEELTKVEKKPEIKMASAEPMPIPPEPKKPDPKPEKTKAEPEKKVEPPPQAKPAEAPPPDPIAEAMKKAEEQKKKDDQKKAEEQKKKLEEQKRKVEEQKRKEEALKTQPAFDPSKIAALLDKRSPQREAATGDTLNQTASLGLPTGRAATLSQSEIDALRAQIQACWNPPAGAVEARELIVKVRLQLRQDGTLTVDPTVMNRGGHPSFQIAAEAALRAIKRCQPYRLPIAKYDVWKDVEVTFDPRDMFRG